MLVQRQTTAPVSTDRADCACRAKHAHADEARTVAVAYENITLTDEAADAIERSRQAALNRPRRKIRRMAKGD